MLIFGLILIVIGAHEGDSLLLKEIPGQWGKTYRNITKKDAVTHYSFKALNNTVARVELTRLNGSDDTPLLAVFRDHYNIIGAQVPVKIDDASYDTVGRSLCPFERDQTLSVELSSYEAVEYELKASVLEWFILQTKETRSAWVKVAQPLFFEYTIPKGVKTVNVIVESDSKSCMTVSVQPKNCPVFDQNNNVLSTGMFQTATTSASIPVTRGDKVDDVFYVVFVMNPRNDSCNPSPNMLDSEEALSKSFNVTVEEAMRDDEFVGPILLVVSAIVVIFIVSIAYTIMELQVDRNMGNQFRRFTATDDMEIREERYYGNMEDDESIRSYDILSDVDDRDVVRRKKNLKVSDLSLKTWDQRNGKYTKYYISLITVSMFYVLPVIQLVLESVNNVKTSGDLDECWYNFRCARPMFGLFAFNNVLSNCGYVFLGFLFLCMTWERDNRYRYMVKLQPELDTIYGLPQHPGISYAIGIAIIMEGLMSASYHVCPTAVNYQFDTSFMYVIGLLGMLKIYQLRHPDIIVNAHKTFFAIAFIILFALLGVKFNSLPLWIIYAVVYPLVMLGISVEFYFKGVWRFKLVELKNSIFYEFLSSRWCSCFLPMHKGRFLFLAIGNIMNVLFVVYGVLQQPNDFASYLLMPFIMNLFLYFFYYIVMKFSHGERLRFRTLIFLTGATALWGISMWFFKHGVSDWSLGAAQSREMNKPCIIMNYFDNHDVWHFSSAVAMFISFTLLDRIDDDLRFVKRTAIPVF